MRARAEPCLHVAGDQRDSKQNGDSRNRGKGGQPACPITTPDRRGRADAHLWRKPGRPWPSDDVGVIPHMSAEQGRYSGLWVAVLGREQVSLGAGQGWPAARVRTMIELRRLSRMVGRGAC